jgi:leucyl-tRNA synthetase
MRVICITDDERAAAMARCLKRLLASDQASPAGAGDSAGLKARLAELRTAGRIVYGEPGDDGRYALGYAPSTQAKSALLQAVDGEDWPRRVQKFAERDVQPINGAVFSLPVYGDPAGASVEAFITDWSPFPAACAIAIHPSHPLADGCENRAGAWTGFYVRHILTGDLLAVWTADWVRPEFGTGAVIVNPAHSDADLAFARAVGLPIRFGLAPDPPPSTDAETWPEPPVIKGGNAVRTGVADGETAARAKEIYLDLLTEAGHASTYTDIVLGLLELGDAGDPRRFDDLRVNEALGSLLSQPIDAADIVIASSGSIADLLAATTLHVDAHGTVPRGEGMLLVQPVELAPAAEVDGRERELLLIGFGRVDEAVSVKDQQVEQVTRFYANHEQLAVPEPVDLSTKLPKRTSRILADVRSGETGRAFAELYKLQRDIKKGEGVSVGDVYSYFAAAHAIADIPLPDGYSLSDVLAAVAA